MNENRFLLKVAGILLGGALLALSTQPVHAEVVSSSNAAPIGGAAPLAAFTLHAVARAALVGAVGGGVGGAVGGFYLAGPGGAFAGGIVCAVGGALGGAAGEAVAQAVDSAAGGACDGHPCVLPKQTP